MDLDQYLRAGLHEPADAVLSAATRWRDAPTTNHVLALREAIDALAGAYVDFNAAVEEFMGLPDVPAVIEGGMVVGKFTKTTTEGGER